MRTDNSRQIVPEVVADNRKKRMKVVVVNNENEENNSVIVGWAPPTMSWKWWAMPTLHDFLKRHPDYRNN